MSDEDATIRLVLEGDVQAFRGLVEKYQGPVYRLARSIINDPVDAEDIAQDCFLAAFRNLASFDPAVGTFSVWLFVIVRNRCRNALKRRRPRSLDDTPEPFRMHRPSDALSEREWQHRFDLALSSLPIEQRTAFTLAEIEELAYETIAKIEDVPLGTVKSRIRRAKDKLRQILAITECEQ